VVVEHAVLSVMPGSEGEFEHAFASAKAIIARMPGLKA
jgi:heme-degrading monooxygenase HmoA